jgi:3-phenylpropionate/trans-cinnamate dioxygenase ferredoxin reductase subunit
MITPSERVLIVGAGQAGARTALALREEGWQGEIVLAGDEPEYPYERPPLSKGVLKGQAGPAQSAILSEALCAEQAITLLRSEPVQALDLAGRRAHLASGSKLAWDHLVIATGSRARELPIPGAHLRGVCTLRTAADALAVRAHLRPGAAVVLVGGGFIGLEVAASAAQMGCRVTVLETADQLLSRVVTGPIATEVEKMHCAHGVDVRTGTRIEVIEGVETVRRVRLADGTAIEAELVVVGIGALANDGLAICAGMACADGILVDAGARTRVDKVYAVGDVARHENLWGASRVRLESWENAELQAAAAARSIVGKPPAPRRAPWFWTDQFDVNLQILGFPSARHEVIIRGSTESPSWCAFMLHEGHVAAACLWNAGRERRAVTQLMDGAQTIPSAALADTARPLREHLKAST